MASSKRLSYTVAYKLEVIRYAKEHGNRPAERHFGPPPTEKMIRQWRKQEDELRECGNKTKRNLHQTPAKWPQLEKDMKEWILQHRNLGIAVNTKMIINEARRLAANKGADDFKGTASWCFRFMKRNGLSLRTRTKISQKMPEEYEQKITAFHKFIINARKQNLFVPVALLY